MRSDRFYLQDLSSMVLLHNMGTLGFQQALPMAVQLVPFFHQLVDMKSEVVMHIEKGHLGRQWGMLPWQVGTEHSLHEMGLQTVTFQIGHILQEKVQPLEPLLPVLALVSFYSYGCPQASL